VTSASHDENHSVERTQVIVLNKTRNKNLILT